MSSHLFSDEEIAAVKSSWNELTRNGLGSFGRILLYRFYNDVPEVRRLFHRIGISDEDPNSYALELLQKNSLFRSHAQRLASGINDIVKNLEKPDMFVKMCTDVGIVHVQHKVQPHHFDELGGVLFKVISSNLELNESHPTMQAWVKTYGFIAAAAKAGLTG